jgi:hypothetical protein
VRPRQNRSKMCSSSSPGMHRHVARLGAVGVLTAEATYAGAAGRSGRARATAAAMWDRCERP